MTPEEELKMWQDRAGELENALQDAINIIKVLKDRGNFQLKQRQEIVDKIYVLEQILIPF